MYIFFNILNILEQPRSLYICIDIFLNLYLDILEGLLPCLCCMTPACASRHVVSGRTGSVYCSVFKGRRDDAEDQEKASVAALTT